MNIIIYIILVSISVYVWRRKRQAENALDSMRHELGMINEAILKQRGSLPDKFCDEEGNKFIRTVDQYGLYHFRKSDNDEEEIPKRYFVYDGQWHSLYWGSEGTFVYGPVDELPPNMN